MLVRDNTPVYSALGKWAGRRREAYGDFGEGSWLDLFKAGVDGTVNIVTTGIKAGAGAFTPATTPAVTPGGTIVIGGGYQQPPPQLPQKAWYQDPLILGAVGLGVVGLGVVLLGRGRRGRMAGFSLAGFSYAPRRRRRSRR